MLQEARTEKQAAVRYMSSEAGAERVRGDMRGLEKIVMMIRADLSFRTSDWAGKGNMR